MSLNKIIFCLVILISLISGAYGDLRVSISAGDNSGSSSLTTKMRTDMSDVIQESATLSGASLSRIVKGSGDRGETFAVTNKKGDQADAGFDIKNSASYSYDYTLSPNSANYAMATESLDVNVAEYINAFANAKSRDGNTAGSGVSVTEGSLKGYKNSAYATSADAKTKQSWTEASGDIVNLDCGSGNIEGETARAIIDNGDLDGIIGSVNGFSNIAEAKKSKASAAQNAKTIQGNYYIDAIGQNQLQNSAGTFALIQGFTTNHISTADATKSKTDAKFSAKDISGRGSIWTNAYVDYYRPNVVTSVNTGWENAKIYAYSNEAKTDTTNLGFILTEGSQKFSSASGEQIDTNLYASQEAETSITTTQVKSGKITKYSDKANNGPSFAQTAVYLSGQGHTAEINSQVYNSALGYEEQWIWNDLKWNWEEMSFGDWDRIPVPIKRGEGVFAVKMTNNIPLKNVRVASSVSSSDLIIQANGFSKTALILDPRRWEFVEDRAANDIYAPVTAFLKEKNYAVTYYSDAAVSKDIVKKMDEYDVSAIHSHAGPTGFYLSKSSDGNTWDSVSAKDFNKWFTKRNDMTLLIGCDSFTDIGKGTLAEAISESKLRGGTTEPWEISYGRDFIISYFQSMSNGNTASQANIDASVANIDSDGNSPRLLLLGNGNFML